MASAVAAANSLVRGGRGNQLKHCLQAILGGALAVELFAHEQHFDARGAPVQLSQRPLQFAVGARRQMQDDDATQLADCLDGICDVIGSRDSRVLRHDRNHESACFGQRALRSAGEIAHVPPHIRPDRRRCIATVRLGQQQDQSAFDAGDQAALNGEPTLTELLRIVRGSQYGPQRAVVTSFMRRRRRALACLPARLCAHAFECGWSHRNERRNGAVFRFRPSSRITA